LQPGFFAVLFTLLMFSIPLEGIAMTKELELDGKLIAQKKNKKKDRAEISTNISAIAIKGGLLAVAADEGADVLLFKHKKGLVYEEVDHQCIKLDGNKGCGKRGRRGEIDIEGLAWGKKHLYAIGSHSLARKTAKNSLKRLYSLKVEPSREQLFRIPVDKNGKLKSGKKIKLISLRNILTNHPLLSRFRSIPSKENGIDIEGLAVKQVEINGHKQERLFIGFRGPVLRGNLALIMELDFNKGNFKQTEIPHKPKIHFLNFEGRGIRGMTTAGEDGFLILTGPVSDADYAPEDTRYRLYHWDGKHDEFSNYAAKPLCYIPTDNGAKAEDLALLNPERKGTEPYELAIVFDGVERGGGKVFSCPPME